MASYANDLLKKAKLEIAARCEFSSFSEIDLCLNNYLSACSELLEIDLWTEHFDIE